MPERETTHDHRHPGPAPHSSSPSSRPRASGPAASSPSGSGCRGGPSGGTSTGCGSWAIPCRRRWARTAGTGWSPGRPCRRSCSTTRRRWRSRSGCGPGPGTPSRASTRRPYGRWPSWNRSCRRRLRHRVSTLQAATTPLTSGDGASIAPETLTVMASAVAGQERLRFAYRAGDGTRLAAPDSSRTGWCRPAAAGISSRTTSTARTGVRSGSTGSPNPSPRAPGSRRASCRRGARRSICGSRCTRRQETYDVRRDLRGARGVRRGPAARVARCARAARRPAAAGCGPPSADSVEWLAVRLAMVDCEFTVHEPAELVECVRELGGRLSRAADGGPPGPEPRGDPVDTLCHEGRSCGRLPEEGDW